MIKFGAGKKLIIIMLSICTILLALFSVVAIVHNKGNNYNPINSNIVFANDGYYGTVTEAPTYNHLDYGDPNYNLEDRDNFKKYYDSKLYFHIYGWWGLKCFREWVSKQYDFHDKEVYLWSDITPPNEANNYWTPIGVVYSADGGYLTYQYAYEFRGHFYGNAHTISNIYCYYNSTNGSQFARYGVFGCLGEGSKVTNLKLKDATFCDWYSRKSGGWGPMYAGGITGEAYGNVTISNCVVENATFILRSANGYAGGIVGLVENNHGTECYSTNLIIENCIVDVVTLELDKDKDSKLSEGCFANIGPVYWAYNGNGAKISYNNILLKECGYKTVSNAGDSSYFRQPDSFWNYNENSGITIEKSLIYNLKTTASTELKENDKKKAWVIEDGFTWNNGWPYLKTYVSFDKYIFKADDNGTINDKSSVSIEVPQEAILQFATAASSQTIAGEHILAKAKTGCYFNNWTQNGKTYTANFPKEEYTLNFTFYDEKGNLLTNNSSNKKITHKYADEILISLIYEGKNIIIKAANTQVGKIGKGSKYILNYVEFLGENYKISSLPTIDLGDNGATAEVKIYFSTKSYNVEYK